MSLSPRRPTSLLHVPLATAVVAASCLVLAGTSPALAAGPRATTVKLTAPASTHAGQKLTLRGKVTSGGKTRVVRVDVRKGGRWKKVVRLRTTTAGRFSLTLSTPDTATTRQYRVTVRPTSRLRRASATRSVKILPASQTPTPTTPDFRTEWDRTSTLLGTASSFTASGVLPGASGRNRKVVLQRRHTDGWQTVARTTTDQAGGYLLRAPSDWLVNLEHRVFAPAATGARPRFSQATRLRVTPTWTPVGDPAHWTLLKTPKKPGQPRLTFRWDPCGPAITYRTNTALAPDFVTANGIAQVVSEVAQATGLRFERLGSTTAHGFSANPYDRPWDTDLVISWSRPSDSSSQLGQPGILGVGGTEGFQGRDARGAVMRVTAGHAVLRAGARELQDEATTWQVLKHELGHAVGLGHSPAGGSGQLMHAYADERSDRQWGAGDLTALRRVGATTGCVDTRQSRGSRLGTQVPDDHLAEGTDPVVAILP